MRIINAMIFLFLTCSLYAQDPYCQVRSIAGDVEVREANQTAWKPLNESRTLKERETIRTGRGGTAKINSFNGEVFTLPESAQIEVRDLRRLSRNDIVMELTGIELQRLPASKDAPILNQTSFVLHGSQPTKTENVKTDEFAAYVNRQITGMLSLFKQGFVAGFIIKWNRFANANPEVTSEEVEAILIRAYKSFKMPFRMKEAAQQFKQKWPDSNLIQM